MPSSANSEVTSTAKTWLLPDQVEQLRDAAHADRFSEKLGLRNEAIVAAMYDCGTRVEETSLLDVEMLRLDEMEPSVYLPTYIQKDYPTDESAPPATLTFTDDLGTARLLKTYLNNRWKDSEALFPSMQSDRMTTKQARNVVTKLAVKADVRPYRVDGSQREPEEVKPHSLRHSVAYRMLNEEGARMYDVRNRLRYRSLQTTERIYGHFLRR